MNRKHLFLSAALAAAQAGIAQPPAGQYLIERHTLPSADPLRSGNPACPELPPEANASALGAADIIKLLGNPSGFSFGTLGTGSVLIYYSKPAAPTSGDDQTALAQIRKAIDDFAALRNFSMELSIPHAGALGDLATRMGALGYSQFTIQDAGPGRIRVSAEQIPDCVTWRRFLDSARRAAWQPAPVSPVQKVFYLDASQLSSALAGGGTGGGNPASQNPGSQNPGSTTPSPTAKTSTAPPVAGPPAPAAAKPAAGGAAKPAAGAAPAPAANPAPAVPASTTPTPSPAPQSQSPASSSSPSGQQQSNSVASSVGAPNATQDLLIFAEPTPGDDSAVHEKNRIVAALDLPRPEMLVNVWSVQASSTNPADVQEAHDKVLQLVSRYNDRLEQSVVTGWVNLKSQMEANGLFFEEHFYKYIAYHHVADLLPNPPSSQPRDPFERASQNALDSNTGATLSGPIRERLGICPANQYCLGYGQLFRPLRPRLTDLLLTVIAANDPAKAANQAANAIEGVTAPPTNSWDKTCEEWDNPVVPGPDEAPPPPQLECFRRTVNEMFREASGTAQPSALGVVRAAIADFLYNYKISQQYPHEFSPYNLGQSAQALNTALNPLVDAFERDVAAYQQRLRDQVEAKRKKGKLGKTFVSDPQTFLNTGVVTVRTISGKETIVDTISQSYLDTTTPPSLSDLITAVSGTSSSSVPASISKNLAAGPASALVGAIGAMQPSSSKIGREFKIDLTPRTLPGAAAAEIDISMNVGESAEPSRYTGSSQTQGNDNLSRVATHNTTTKVRIDSLKLFDVSSFTAVVSRSRSRVPLLPLPLVEIPYIGTLVGWPRGPAKEFHTSVGVLSALVVPTAADLAYGLAYTSDRVLEIDPNLGCMDTRLNGCLFRTARALRDLNEQPIASFHKAMVNCLATELRAAYPRMAVYPAGPSAECTALGFEALERDAN